MSYCSSHLPRVDEGDFHESQEIRGICTAYSPRCGSLDLQDIRGRIGVQDAHGIVPRQGAVLLGLAGHRVKVLSAVQRIGDSGGGRRIRFSRTPPNTNDRESGEKRAVLYL
jgi:hypothetical protein